MTADAVLIEEPDFGENPPNSTGERRMVTGLGTPFPLINAVPPMLAEDPFVQRMMPAFDEVLAPIINTLDCFPYYLDPSIAPMDMVTYMASWLFPSYEDQLSEEGLRHALATVVERSGWRGTKRGVIEALETFQLASIDIQDSGGTIVGGTPSDPTTWPEVAAPAVTVTCVMGPNSSLNESQIRAVMRFLVPAHVLVSVVVS